MGGAWHGWRGSLSTTVGGFDSFEGIRQYVATAATWQLCFNSRCDVAFTHSTSLLLDPRVRVTTTGSLRYTLAWMAFFIEPGGYAYPAGNNGPPHGYLGYGVRLIDRYGSFQIGQVYSFHGTFFLDDNVWLSLAIRWL